MNGNSRLCHKFILVPAILVVLIIGNFGPKGGDVQAGELGDSFMTAPSFTSANTPTLSITEDGQLEIDGKSIERMSDPEIKAILKEIAESLQYFDRQTGYLLQELEKCLKSKQGGSL